MKLSMNDIEKRVIIKADKEQGLSEEHGQLVEVNVKTKRAVVLVDHEFVESADDDGFRDAHESMLELE